MMSMQVVFKAPARVCLFGDHQDYLELPVIACAIDRFIELKASPNDTEVFNFSFLDLKLKRNFSVNESFEVLEKGDHIAAVYRVVQRYGCFPTTGYDISIESDIPINAGLSSSSALAVVWTRFLLNTFGCRQEITDELIAQIAYEAEVVEQNSPGGRMDQYSIAIGDIIFLKTDSSSYYDKMRRELDCILIGESGDPKNTVGVLGGLREKAMKAIEYVKKEFPDFILEQAKNEDILYYSKSLPSKYQPYFSVAIENHEITKKAYSLLRESTLDYKILGELMSEHHAILRDTLKVTTPKIDAMIDAALENNAYGAKIVGSGGGGSICVIAAKKYHQQIIMSLLNAGATKAYSVNVVSNEHADDK